MTISGPSAWRRMLFTGTLCAIAFLPKVSFGQWAVPYQTYRLEYDTVYEPQQVTAYRLEYETAYDEQRVTTYRPETTTETRERRYVVRRMVPETSFREEQYTTAEPVVTYRQQTVDQGNWQTQQTVLPGQVVNRLSWQRGGWVVDPYTGAARYQWPGFAWVPYRGPERVQVQRVWQPQLVTQQVPVTTYVQKVNTRRIPVTTYRAVDEERLEQVPVQVTRMVPHEEVRQIPRTVVKRVPYSYTCQVPRTVVRRVPIAACPPVDCCQPVYAAPPASSGAPSSGVPQTYGSPNGAQSGGNGNGASETPTIDPNENVPGPVDPESNPNSA